MSYTCVDDLKLRLGDLYAGIYVRLDGTPMVGEAQADLDAAAAEIEAHIGVRYRTPVADAVALPLLKIWTLTLAEELAWSRSGKAEIPKNVADRVANIRKVLEGIAAGEKQLPGATEKTGSGATLSIVDAAKPVYTRKNLKGY